MIVFSLLFMLVVATLVATVAINGFHELNLHMACYGLILLCVGYLIDVSRKQKVSSISEQIEWMMDKKYGALVDEIKGLRTLILALEERRVVKGDGKKSATPNIDTTRRRLELELDKMSKVGSDLAEE